MPPTNLSAARDIFLRAVDIESDGDRRAMLEQACQGDDPLRERVEALLRAHFERGSFLAYRPPAAPPTEVRRGSSAYRVRGKIGAGGMATVYLADQLEPVRRQVALKVIKPGMDSRQVLSRFDVERNALALMNHPNIAQVYDAGLTNTAPAVELLAASDGGTADATLFDWGTIQHGGAQPLPFFAMEYVDGPTLTTYCDLKRFSICQRLDLFIPVCLAVHHSHQKGIIHRDLKPSNVLVAEVNGQPMPKVIDFGVAKAVTIDPGSSAAHSEAWAVVGTIEYMPPEQTGMTSDDVDTRCDIYSLGALLYELLSGVTPLDRDRLRTLMPMDALRAVRVEPVPPPSERLRRLSTAGPTDRSDDEHAKPFVETLAELRRTDPARLTRALRGDLDAIVMKCLEKDRTRRYESADALVRDLRRYQDDLPIEARRPSPLHVARKFVRRNAALVSAAAAVAIVLVGGLAGTLFGLREARHEQKRFRRLSYISDMNLAMRAWDENRLQRCRELLERHRPIGREPDLRGFDWHLLDRMLDGTEAPAIDVPYGAHSVVCSPVGPSLAVGLQNGRVLLYADAHDQSPRSFGQVLPDPWYATYLAYSSSGDKLYYQNLNRLFEVEIDSGRQREVLSTSDRNNDIRCLCVSNDDRYLFCGTAQGQVLVHDLAETQQFEPLSLPASGNSPPIVHSLAVSHDGKLLAAGGDSRKILVWNWREGQVVRTFEGHRGSVDGGLAFAQDDRAILSGSADRTVRLWPLDSGLDPPSLVLSAVPRRVGFSPDGRFALATSGDGRAHLLNAKTLELRQSIRAHSSSATSGSFTRDGNTLVTSGGDRQVRFHDVGPTWNGHTIDCGTGVLHLHVLRDGSSVLVRAGRANKTPDRLRTWDLRTGRELPFDVPGAERVDQLAVSTDDRALVSNGLGDVLLLDVTRRESRPLAIPGDGVSALAFSPSGRWIAVGREDGKLEVWNETDASPRTVSAGAHNGIVNCLEFSVDGQVLMSGGVDGHVRAWRWSVNRPDSPRSVGHHDAAVMCLAISPHDPELLASCSWDSTVTMWHWRSGRRIQTLRGHQSHVHGLAFHPRDPAILASAGGGAQVILWDLPTGLERLQLALDGSPHGRPLAFSPDGTLLVTGDRARRMYIWRTKTKPR